MSLRDNLCEALRHLGADPSAYEFDDHSTIVMTFDDVGEIFLDPQQDARVWMWGTLQDLDDSARDLLAAELLREIVRPTPHWEAGAMVLREDGRTGGLLHPECVAAPILLASALQDFHQCLLRLQAIR